MKKMKKELAVIMSFVVAAAMTACGNTSDTSDASDTTTSAAEETVSETAEAAEETSAEETTEAETEAADETEAETEEEADDEENYDTGDASLDNIRNQDDIGDNELLVLSFGTSFNDSRRLTIGAVEGALE